MVAHPRATTLRPSTRRRRQLLLFTAHTLTLPLGRYWLVPAASGWFVCATAARLQRMQLLLQLLRGRPRRRRRRRVSRVCHTRAHAHAELHHSGTCKPTKVCLCARQPQAIAVAVAAAAAALCARLLRVTRLRCASAGSCRLHLQRPAARWCNRAADARDTPTSGSWI